MKLIDEGLLKLVHESELNGCGSKGLGWMVRDRWGGVDFSKAGDVHDASFYLISTIYPFITNNNLISIICFVSRNFHFSLKTKKSAIRYANKTFYKNLCIINDSKSKTQFGRLLRKPIIFSYYFGVKIFGKYFF